MSVEEAEMEQDMTNIAKVLSALADQIERAPIHLVGASINVSGGNGGSATGLRISVSAGPKGTSTTGMIISVDPNEYTTKASGLVADLREAAAAAENAKPAKSWVFGLLDRAKSLGNKAIDTAIVAAVNALTKAYVG
ncbi:hypothetical protein ABMA46_16120 [Mesorhizobium sp. CN5-321]|jgi:hypothetical protein|uniref:hypothetical protein n=1 Tax=Mesorhizobium hunchu TaxID=3157708 RepID=UPI0032B7DA00